MMRGLTLIELVVTISLAGIIGIPVGILLSEHISGSLRARDYTVAMSLARREMETLDSFNNFCHASLNIIPGGTLFDPYQGTSYALRRTVVCQAGGSNCTSACDPTPATTDNAVKRIMIVVTKSGLTEPLASVVTYRTKYVRFGQ
jgi:prepilin-type N-terminal cleavage/methylation domain-containing protein